MTPTQNLITTRETKFPSGHAGLEILMSGKVINTLINSPEGYRKNLRTKPFASLEIAIKHVMRKRVQNLQSQAEELKAEIKSIQNWLGPKA